MARAFQDMNTRHAIYSDAQKGFIKKTNGCSEHGIMLNELFQDAKRKRKSLIVTTVDFANAFGSVPHEMIMSTLKQRNFPEWVRAIVEDMYTDARSTIEYRGRQTQPIRWRKGVKQGCPLSPLLFNLCVEPLLAAIKGNQDIRGAYVQVGDKVVKFTVQAYADDIVFISECEDGIAQMLSVLEGFTEWSRMEVNVSKCATASHVFDEDGRRAFLNTCFKFRGEEIPTLTTAESMRYLDAPISARRSVKLKSVKFKLGEMEILLEKIMASPLLTVQKIDAVKTFLLPSIDFLLLNGEVGSRELRTMDRKIRGAINRDMKISGLPVECHHASWRDGGLSYPSLLDRGDVLTIRSFVQMMLSQDEGIRVAMRQCVEDERIYRGIDSDPEAAFLDWKNEANEQRGTASIIAKTRKACKRLDVGLKMSHPWITLKATESEKRTCSAIGVGRYLTQKVIRPRKLERLLAKEKHGATFPTLRDNPISNGILIDAKTTRSDAFFRFVVAGRADLLPTPANIEQWYKKPRSICRRCEKEAQPTLAHILNGCRGNFTQMTRRHNAVVDVVRRAIEDNMPNRVHSAIGENTIIEEQGLSEEVRSLRPDLNFVASSFAAGAFYTVLIDISCPYGRISFGDNTLEKVYVDKLVKYGRLARELQTLRHMRVEIIPVIVSSMGAVHPKSLKELEHLFGDEDVVKKMGKRLSEAAIAGSFQIWRGYAQSMQHSEDAQIGRMATREARMLGAEGAVERVGEGQEVGSGPGDDASEERRERGGEGEGEGEEGREAEDLYGLMEEIEVEVELEQLERESEREDECGSDDDDDDDDEAEIDEGSGEREIPRSRSGREARQYGRSEVDARMEDFLG
jgi:hypothetical protein